MSRTKSHTTTHPPLLSIEQRNAIDLLILGQTDAQVAAAVGRNREAICPWRNDNPYFIAELNHQRQALWQSAQERLRSLIGKAIDVVEQALERGEVKAASALLKAVGLDGGVGAPQGDTDPERVLWRQAEVWALAEIRRDPGDPLLAPLLHPERQAALTQQRLAVLRAQYLGEQPPQGQAQGEPC